jgi:hypothetical protein
MIDLGLKLIILTVLVLVFLGLVLSRSGRSRIGTSIKVISVPACMYLHNQLMNKGIVKTCNVCSG